METGHNSRLLVYMQGKVSPALSHQAAQISAAGSQPRGTAQCAHGLCRVQHPCMHLVRVEVPAEMLQQETSAAGKTGIAGCAGAKAAGAPSSGEQLCRWPKKEKDLQAKREHEFC